MRGGDPLKKLHLLRENVRGCTQICMLFFLGACVCIVRHIWSEFYKVQEKSLINFKSFWALFFGIDFA